jgi:hypothetical protein
MQDQCAEITNSHTKITVVESINHFEHNIEVTELFALKRGRKAGTHPCSLSAVNNTDV